MAAWVGAHSVLPVVVEYRRAPSMLTEALLARAAVRPNGRGVLVNAVAEAASARTMVAEFMLS